MWTGCDLFGTVQWGEGSRGHGNVAADTVKGGEFVDQLSDYQLLQKPAPWR
jgi:hypothetical protein